MAETNFNLRGINSKVMELLKREAKRQHTSVNLLIIDFIERCIGYSKKTIRPTYDDLDHLAGTWQKQDVKTFTDNTKQFDKIDKDIW